MEHIFNMLGFGFGAIVGFFVGAFVFGPRDRYFDE